MEGSVAPLTGYHERIVDLELDELIAHLPAVSLEGPKGVGKTSTAERRGGTTIRLDDSRQREVVQGQHGLLVTGTPPIVIDEWQQFPESWDIVRRAVDADHSPGRFILTGSATPSVRPTHSGAARIVPIRMRPLTLSERGVEVPTVSLSGLLGGRRPAIEGATAVELDDYVSEIMVGGFPALRFSSGRAQRAALDGYLERIIDTDLPELGVNVRTPATLGRWLRAYAAATATTASYDKVRDAATSGEEAKPGRNTTHSYREALERLWILDPVPAWAPTSSHLTRLLSVPKHHLADPALAARVLGIEADALLAGQGPDRIHRDGTFLGALFESLATLSVRVFAQAGEARTSHFRTRGGEHEVDLIVERGDHRVLAVEVKLSQTVADHDVRHLRWLHDRIGDDLLDAIVVTTGAQAYRRADGIGVVPLALLGP